MDKPITINFKITGNQEDKNGNPIPFTRILRQAGYTPEALRYKAWQTYVRKCFYDQFQIRGVPMAIDDSYVANPAMSLKLRPASNDMFPLCFKTAKAEVSMKIYWANLAHGDTDNVFKGVLDSLFDNDKCVYKGSFEAYPAGNKAGTVEITIKLITKDEYDQTSIRVASKA